jgi:hypothetical protein
LNKVEFLLKGLNVLVANPVQSRDGVRDFTLGVPKSCPTSAIDQEGTNLEELQNSEERNIGKRMRTESKTPSL